MRVAAAAVLLAVLLSCVQAQTDVLEVQAVPETSVAARQLLQGSDSVGGYYGESVSTSYGYGYGSPSITGRRRQLLQGSGGYGTYGMSTGGYGYGYGRGLMEDDVILEPSDPLLEYAEQHAADTTSTGGLSAALQQAQASSSKASRQQLSFPAGKCYCRYDTDFNTWALAEDTCKEALYQRCKTESGLPCPWLDQFYSPISGPGFAMPHESDIKAFVHEDCSPNPPCACAGVKFDGSDSVPLAVACCRDLRVACRTPFSGVHCKKVEAFCSDDKPTPVLAAWSQHVLHHSDCSNYNGLPYKFATLQEIQQHAAAAAQRPQYLQQAIKPAAAESALLSEAMHSWLQSQRPLVSSPSSAGSSQRRLVIALAAVAAGAVCVAAVAVVFAMRKEEASAPITSACEPLLSTAEVYQSLIKKGALAQPKPAACIGSSCGLPPLAPLRRDESGDSCMSRVSIAIGRLNSQGSTLVRELSGQQSLSRSISNSSDAYSTGSISGDNVP